MPRKAPTLDTLRALFAKSGNTCAFPGCTQLLINEKNQFIGQVCHIRAAESLGERFDPTMTDEARRHFDNLVLLCYPHHVETNDVFEYTVPRLVQIKLEHEKANGAKPFKIDEARLYTIMQEMDRYWERVRVLVDDQVKNRPMAFNLDIEQDYLDLFDNLRGVLERKNEIIRDINEATSALHPLMIDHLKSKYGINVTSETDWKELGYLLNPLWEFRYLALPNLHQQGLMLLAQLEVQVMSDILKLNSNDPTIRIRLKKAQQEFDRLIKTSTIYD